MECGRRGGLFIDADGETGLINRCVMIQERRERQRERRQRNMLLSSGGAGSLHGSKIRFWREEFKGNPVRAPRGVRRRQDRSTFYTPSYRNFLNARACISCRIPTSMAPMTVIPMIARVVIDRAGAAAAAYKKMRFSLFLPILDLSRRTGNRGANSRARLIYQRPPYFYFLSKR